MTGHLTVGVVVVMALAFLFDFLNGMHDAANSIATIVSTRVLRPSLAVFWAAFFNFIAFLVFGLTVAETVGKGIVQPEIVTAGVIFAALCGAIVWNVVTWLLGIPSSSSHALIGGLVGAAVAKSGFEAVVWSGFLKTSAAIVLSPMLGFVLALVLVGAVSWIFVRKTPLAVDTWLRTPRFGLAATTHKKTMGVISVLLYSQGYVPKGFYVPRVLSCRPSAAACPSSFACVRVPSRVLPRIVQPRRRPAVPERPSRLCRR